MLALTDSALARSPAKGSEHAPALPPLAGRRESAHAARTASTSTNWSLPTARSRASRPRTLDILRAPTKKRRHYSMPQPRRRRHGPQPDRRRALELLAASRDGCTEAMLRA